MEISNGFVCLLGMGTVFVGLGFLVLLCMLLRAVCHRPEPDVSPAAAEEVPGAAGGPELLAAIMAAVSADMGVQPEIPNRQAVISAISAAIAEDMGTGVSGIRILSLRQLERKGF